MVNKLITASPGRSWVGVVEYPDESLCLEGIIIDPTPNDPPGHPRYSTSRIRFSLEAVERLIPLMQEWVKTKRE